MPFVRTAEAGPSAPVEVVVNLALFVPFGVYLGLLAPSWAWWKAAGTIAEASLVLEATQYILGIGSSDVTDVVVNTAGGLAGLGLLALARRKLQARTAAVMTRVCAIGTVLAVLAVGIFVASPLRYLPPPDAAVVTTHSASVEDLSPQATVDASAEGVSSLRTFGAPGGTRTPNPFLRTELLFH